jgi:periplasmic protein TonB
MKKIIAVFCFMIFCQIAVAQEKVETVDNNVYSSAGIDKQPEFPGGLNALVKYIQKNFKLPNVKGLNGRVFTVFVVEKDGSVSDFKVLRDLGYGTGEEAIRVIKLFPPWIPGQQDGKFIRVKYGLPININTL